LAVLTFKRCCCPSARPTVAICSNFGTPFFRTLANFRPLAGRAVHGVR
jgi:hypothetical protein